MGKFKAGTGCIATVVTRREDGVEQSRQNPLLMVAAGHAWLANSHGTVYPDGGRHHFVNETDRRSTGSAVEHTMATSVAREGVWGSRLEVHPTNWQSIPRSQELESVQEVSKQTFLGKFCLA